jgi:CHAD domain-containing protein
VDAQPDWLTLPAERGARLLALGFLRDAEEARKRIGEDGEALHDFRVALRRLRATLSEYRAVLRPDVRRKDRRRAAALVRPTGAARDGQVQAAWVEERLGGLADEERAGAERLLDELRSDAAKSADATHRFRQFDKRLSRRLATYRVSAESGAAASGSALAIVLAARVRRASERLRGSIDEACADALPEALHRTRLAGKRLRYLVEPFAE